ncbi:hypothetical protein SASPL_135739 [Salvia splendens]|uniref:Carboxypeptidase n=1 Tax=Salvia splendens TaxID=180675 RepID=A0A8X8X0R5_SALSN|nr:hypothetical protein SASPL_135739 [Salvia splendens]
MIYLESPAGIGLSYSTNKSDYTTEDLKTASDSHTFLLKWFELYPEYQSNPFYISGESYAGIYIPTLAFEVANGIDAGVKPILNLKGYLVGNGVTDAVFDGNSFVPFAHGMGLIPDELFEVRFLNTYVIVQEAVNSECNGDYYNPTGQNCGNKLVNVDEALNDLNIYDILEPCYHAPASIIQLKNSSVPPSFRKLGETERPLPVRKRIFGRAWPYRAPVRDGYVPTWPQLLNGENVPCTDEEVADIWLNNEAVRKALHADSNSSVPLSFRKLGETEMPLPVRKRIFGRAWPCRAPVRDGYVPTWPQLLNGENVPCTADLTGRWDLCTDRISFHHDAGSMIKYHKNLTSRGYQALIYSGDHGMCVPFTGSEAWTRSMGYKIIDEWRPWYVKGQVSGYCFMVLVILWIGARIRIPNDIALDDVSYTQGYDYNLTFLTINSRGLDTPCQNTSQPRR